MFFKDYKANANAQIRESLLWEYHVDDIDYHSMKNIIIQRVIERGRLNDFYAILNFYGVDEIKRIIKNLPYLNDKDIAFVCAVFEIDKESLKCYTRKQSQKQHWNS